MLGQRLRQFSPGVWRLLALALAVALVASTVAAVAVQAQDEQKLFHWTQYDYDVDIQRNGDMLFTVTMGFSFDQGSFSQGFYAFDMDRVEDVRDVQVSEGEERYREGSAETAGRFTVTTGADDNQFEVLWGFPRSSGIERTFTLHFRVVGGLRIYEGGDQFYWNFYAGDRAGRIERGTITVHLPAAVEAADLRMAADPSTVNIVSVDADTVRATVREFPAYTTAVLRVQFPHGLVTAEAAAWQAADDRMVDYNERWRPLVELGLLGIGVLILFGGVGGVIALWYSRGRDKPVGLAAEYVTEPPSDLAAELAGTLVDERADIRDVLATIISLGRKGVIQIEETEDKGLFGLGKKDFVYRLLRQDVALTRHEQSLVHELFGGATEKRLSTLKNQFYRAIPRIGKEMFLELTEQGYFVANPERTRNKFVSIGVVGLVGAVALFCLFGSVVANYASTFFCLPASLGAVFVTVLIVASAMPQKTEKGATEAAGWNAFKRYLKDIDRYDNLQEKAAIFERFLPYAVAFGIEKDYIRKFARVEAPAPPWFVPYPPILLGGPGRYARGGGMTPVGDGAGGVGGAGMPSLQGMSDSMASSLQGMSDSLVSMLNSASQTLTSAPQSSGRGGGGGWSGGGGGFGGGGGGGGGSGAR